jgi:chromate reductase, NAD(P)H dehydrogenase (quinone)
MTDPVKVMVICGSLRKDSYNGALARTAPKLAPAGITMALSPPLDAIPMYNFDVQRRTGIPAPVDDLGAAIAAADGVLICSPEYNWSIPGGLKNAIDWISRLQSQPFANKPVALQSASTSLLGGSRMQYHLRQTLASIGAFIFGRPEVFVNFAEQKFDAETLELKDQGTIDLVRQQLTAFETFVRTGRNDFQQAGLQLGSRSSPQPFRS